MASPYRRVILKLSGEALGLDGKLFCHEKFEQVARMLIDIQHTGVELAVVIGGGNVWRGRRGAAMRMGTVAADQMGMLATLQNCLYMRDTLDHLGARAVVMSGVDIPRFAESYNTVAAIEHLRAGRILFLACGLGNPCFSTDSAVVLRAIELECDAILMAKNIDGVYTADPHVDPSATLIPRITYAELREMAFMGASVLHEESILPVKEKGISLNIRNTNRPDEPGTFIVEHIESESELERPITGIAGRRNFTILTVLKRNMNASTTLCNALEILDRYHASVEHITLGLDSFALVVSSAALENTLYDVIADIQKTCRPDDARVQDGIALVAAVGRKMPARPGTSGKLFQALGEHGLNIRTIAQGADELSIIVGVENCDFEKAIRVLYDGFTG